MEVDVISYKEGLYLATLGGARALGIDVSVRLGSCCKAGRSKKMLLGLPLVLAAPSGDAGGGQGL
jgi:hypothetical protein